MLELLTYSLEQSPSWESNRFSGSQEIAPRFVGPEGLLPQSQVPVAYPYPEPDQSNQFPIPLPEILLNIILPSTLGSFKWFPFL